MEISNAYDVLSNAEKRRIYDKFGEEGLQKGGQRPPEDHFDIFSQWGLISTLVS